MASDTMLFVFGLFDTGTLLFLTVYFWVLPEIIGHCVMTVLLLVLGFHWILFLVNLPMAAWQIYSYASVPSGNVGVYDPTEIHNRGMLKGHMKEAMIKLGYYLIFFFIYLYCLIVSLLTKDPLPEGGSVREEVEF